jgi:hypothetical protein
MELDKLTKSESDNINIIGFIAALIVVSMFVTLLFCYFMKTTKHLNKIIFTLAGIYMVLIIAGAILYFVYRNNKADVGSENDMLIKPIIGVVIGVLITTIVFVLKNKMIEHFPISGGFYLMNDSTSTIIGDSTSPMELTKTD